MNDDETEKLCLADKAACVEKNGYVLDKECLTQTQCEADGWHVANDASLTCDVTWCQYYELTNGTCVTETECKNDHSGYLYEASSPKKCMTEEECKAENYIFAETKECIDADACTSKNNGGRTYEAVNGFCLEIGCEEHLYSYVNYWDGYTACITYEECIADRNGLVYDDGYERFCLADKASCAAKSGFTLDKECLTEAQCTSKGRIPNSVDHTCDEKAACAADQYRLENGDCVDEDICA